MAFVGVATRDRGSQACADLDELDLLVAVPLHPAQGVGLKPAQPAPLVARVQVCEFVGREARVAGLAVARTLHVLGEFAGPSRHGQVQPRRGQREREFVGQTKPADRQSRSLAPVTGVSEALAFPLRPEETTHDTGAKYDVLLALFAVH